MTNPSRPRTSPGPRPGITTRILKGIAASASPAGRRGRLAILIYHRVIPEHDPMRPSEVDAAAFEVQVAALAQTYNILPLTEAVGRLEDGTLPARAAAITFDDGYADNIDIALPILLRWNAPATFFISTGFLDGGIMWNDVVIESIRQAQGRTLDLTTLNLGTHTIDRWSDRTATAARLVSLLKYTPPSKRTSSAMAIANIAGTTLPRNLMMQSSRIREITNAGMEVGAHTETHPILTAVQDHVAQAEIEAGKLRLEELTGGPVKTFAYPNGKPGVDYTRRHVDIVRRLGLLGAVSTAWGAARRGADIYQLPRFTPWDRSPGRFTLRLIHNGMRRDIDQV